MSVAREAAAQEERVRVMGQFGAGKATGDMGALTRDERILSCANLVMTDGNTLLDDEDLEMITALRMNREFMKQMRAKYPKVGRQPHRQTAVDIDDLA